MFAVAGTCNKHARRIRQGVLADAGMTIRDDRSHPRVEPFSPDECAYLVAQLQSAFRAPERGS